MYHDNRNNCDCRLSKRQIRSEMLKIRDSLDPSFVLSAADCLEKEFFRLLSAETEKDGSEAAGRDSSGSETAAAASSGAAHEKFRRPLTVMSYMSFRNEFPTHSFNRRVLTEGMRLILPETDRDFRLHARLTENPDQLVRSSFGVLQPDPKRCPEMTAEEPDVILLPGVAFDRQGNRIGFGKGCYDRFLAGRTRPVILIGAAYLFQISDSPLPAEPEDIPADFLITEKGIIRCSRQKTEK